MLRNTIVGLAFVVVIAVIAFAVIEDRNDGPLENAAESIDDAADDVADDVEDAADDLDEDTR